MTFNMQGREGLTLSHTEKTTFEDICALFNFKILTIVHT